MERFFENDPEREQKFFDSLNDDEMMDEMNNEGIAYIDPEGVMQVMNIDLAHSELKHHLISKAVEICEKNIFWRFKKVKTKMREIHTVYEWLKLMTEEDDDFERLIEE